MSTPWRLRDILDSGDQALPCGESVDETLEQAADGHAGDLSTHQHDCVHC